jgi:hypothetical protein
MDNWQISFKDNLDIHPARVASCIISPHCRWCHWGQILSPRFSTAPCRLFRWIFRCHTFPTSTSAPPRLHRISIRPLENYQTNPLKISTAYPISQQARRYSIS